MMAIPMWLFFAILSPMLWSIVFVMDAHCVKVRFEKPWLGFITSSLATLVLLGVIALVLPFRESNWPAWHLMLAAIAIGMVIHLSQLFYFLALGYTEAGIVATYWALVPLIVPIASYLLFAHVLQVQEYIGIGVLIAASVAMCLLDENITFRWRSFLLMGLASLLQATGVLALDRLFAEVSYFEVFVLMLVGTVAAGMAPLTVPQVRQVFRRNWSTLSVAGPLLLGIELANLGAYASSYRAIELGLPSLVMAVESAAPGFAFLLSLMLWRTTEAYGEEGAGRLLWLKLLSVGAMVWGIWLLASATGGAS